LQRWWVRASTACYSRFTLAISSSLGFGSTPGHKRPVRTRFRCGSAWTGLTCATEGNSPVHSTKSTPSPVRPRTYRAPTGMWAQGFRSISPPLRGTFHLSLTVLVRYRSSRVFSLRRWSASVPTQFHVLGGTQVSSRRDADFGYGAVTRSGRPSQAVRLPASLVTPRCCCRTTGRSYNPDYTKPAGHVCRAVWAGPGSFATTTGMISLPRGT
jgi:hypothetical protein